MKLLVLKENLKRGLDIVSRITTKTISLPILNNVLLSTKKNFLCLTTTDLEIAIKYWILAKIEKEGKIAVPAKTLVNLVSFLPKNQILLEENRISLDIECENIKARIKGSSTEDFPVIPQIEKEEMIEVQADVFCRGLLQVVENAAISQTRPELSGVYLSFQKDKVVMAATDSFRLAEKKLFFARPQNLEKTLILPQKTSRELINTCQDQAGKLKIYFSANQIMFELIPNEFSQPQIEIISRLIEGDYPNYQEIIPKQCKTEVVLNKEEFLHYLKTAGIFSGRTQEVKIKVDLERCGVEIFSQSQEVGESRSFLAAKIKGEKTKVSFNSRFLIDGLTVMTSKEVILGLNSDDGPAILRPVGDPTFIYIVMPIKTV